MAYKCKWCQDTGKYYPLHGPAEPCRECAAAAKVEFPKGLFYLQRVSLDEFKRQFTPAYNQITVPIHGDILKVCNLNQEEYAKLRGNVPYSGSGVDQGLNAYIATEAQYGHYVRELLGWQTADSPFVKDPAWEGKEITQGHWIMKHALQSSPE